MPNPAPPGQPGPPGQLGLLEPDPDLEGDDERVAIVRRALKSPD